MQAHFYLKRVSDGFSAMGAQLRAAGCGLHSTQRSDDGSHSQACFSIKHYSARSTHKKTACHCWGIPACSKAGRICYSSVVSVRTNNHYNESYTEQ